ncbi:MAG TPA: hypothetical protein DCE41_11795, partial [Cytophagales bacterium]|nr:hypothetical protein [Cytophagales bacterium]
MSAFEASRKPNEQSLVLWMFFHSFCIGIFTAFCFSTANTLFVEDWRSDRLPVGYLVAGGVGMLIVNVYSYLQKRLQAATLFRGVFLFNGLLMCLFALLLSGPILPRSWLSFALFVLSVPLITLMSLETSGLSLLLFDLRQSKKYFALFSTGNVIASILGYLTIPLLLKILSNSSHFLWFSAAGCFLGLFVLRTILKRFFVPDTEANIPQEALEEEAEVEIKIFKNPYLRLIGTCTILSMIGIYFVDFGFIDALSLQHADDPDAFIQAYAVFFSLVKIGELIFSLLSGRILGALSIRFGLVFVPVAMLIGTLLAYSADYLTLLVGIPSLGMLVFFFATNQWLNLVGISSFE